MSVTIVSPSGNPEVWPDDKAVEKLAQGYSTIEVWQAQQKALAEQQYQQWLASPDTVEERFSMLRAARDAKLAAHDVKIAQLQREARMGVDVSSYLAAWDAYAQALCTLPEQAGAPWDGGGELTPWPVHPDMQ